MGWVLQIIMDDGFTGIRIFKTFAFGIVHPSSNVKGILFAIWRIQIQLCAAYEEVIKIDAKGKGYA